MRHVNNTSAQLCTILMSSKKKEIFQVKSKTEKNLVQVHLEPTVSVLSNLTLITIIFVTIII